MFSSISLPADESGRKKVKSVEAASLLATRCVIESVYGIVLNFNMTVENLTESNFQGTAEATTGKRTIKGVELSEAYDSAQDIAQVTASVKLSRLRGMVDKEVFDIDRYPEKVIRRVAFASSTPENARKIGALRAAEVDAYRKLSQKITGIVVQSETKIDNFVLTSDTVKARLKATIMMAEFVEYHWEGDPKDPLAVVTLQINLKELSDMLGQPIDADEDLIKAVGRGVPATDEDFAKSKRPPPVGSTPKDEVVEAKFDFGSNPAQNP